MAIIDTKKLALPIQSRMLTDRAAIKRSINQMTILTIILCIIVLLSAIYLQLDFIYLFCSVLLTAMFAGLVLINIFNKIKWANYIAIIVLPIGVNAVTLIGGGDFGDTYIMIAITIYSYYLIKNDRTIKFILITYNIVLHVSVLIYISIYPPNLPNVTNHLDNAAIFVMVLGWIAIVLRRNAYKRNRLVDRLQIKNEDLLQSTEELERFTYIASHDLKSPLRNIISFSDLLDFKIKRKKYEEIPEYLEYITSGAEQMSALLNDIMEIADLSKNEKVQKENMDLNSILDKVLTNLTQEIAENNVEIEKNQLPSYMIRESEFILVFQNLIQNGIKYNGSKNPKIKIWHTENEGSIHIKFKDNGIGMDEKYHETIFQFFKRLHSNDKYEGTGIGLGVCQKIIKNYNGKIVVESEINKGSTFTISLPISKTSK